MLLKIREYSQGFLSWILLVIIGVPFALWGIQNYVDVGKETPVVVVGGQEFFQRNVNLAYEQYRQQFARANIDEDILKKQALEKLIRDEVLLQYTQDNDLVIPDEAAKSFVKSLPYFQTDGKFNKSQYQSTLASQGMTSGQFIEKVRKAIQMEQFQKGILESGFATNYDINLFYKIQNQQRQFEYVTVPLIEHKGKIDEKLLVDYFQNHSDTYKTPEQVSIEYLELSTDELAKKVSVTEEQLKTFYEEQKQAYSTPERRKISHILIKVADDADDKVIKAAKEKLAQIKKQLSAEDFAALATKFSDDKLTATKGGDLGLLMPGVMEKSFEKAAFGLNQNEVSEPVKTSFGYHLIKVTELEASKTKSFEQAKEQLTGDYQRNSAENTFYELGEKLAEVSYETPDNLSVASEATGLVIKKSSLFSGDKGTGIAAEKVVRQAAFSKDVLEGNNSEVIEITENRVVVLRVAEHKEASTLTFDSVKKKVESAWRKEQSEKITKEKLDNIFDQLEKGKSLEALAKSEKLKHTKSSKYKRTNNKLAWELNQAVFKASKPEKNKPVDVKVALASGDQAIVRLTAVYDGEMTAEEEKQKDMILANIARLNAQGEFSAVLRHLEANADVERHVNN